MTTWGLKPGWVIHPEVWYPGESISPGLSSRRVSLPEVWYPGESVSWRSDTPASQSAGGLIPRRVSLPKVWYPGESVSRRSDTPASVHVQTSITSYTDNDNKKSALFHLGKCIVFENFVTGQEKNNNKCCPRIR